MIRLDVLNSRELQAILLAIRRAPREIQKEIRQRTKPMVQAEWQAGLRDQASTTVLRRVLADTGRAYVSNQNVRLASAASKRPAVSGGLRPAEHGHAVEFGAPAGEKSVFSRASKKGGRHQVTRYTGRQLAPKNRKGRVVYPTAAKLIPRIASLWVQTTIRTFYEQLERK